MKQLIFHIFPLAILAFNFACVTESTDQSTNGIELSGEDIAVTQVWLRIKFSANTGGNSFTLTRNGQNILSVSNAPNDTVVVDGSLQPHHTYIYTASRSQSALGVPGASVGVTTMDTTSHDIEWHLDTLGGGTPGVTDIALINDSLIYTVGNVYTRDSVSQLDTVPWNAGVWKGKNWKLLAIPVQDPPNTPNYCKCVLRGILALSPTLVWLTINNEVITWSGSGVDGYSYAPGTLDRLWSQSANSVYAVGYPGNISHFNGTVWKSLPSGTTTYITDIWGSSMSPGKAPTILCTVSDLSGSGDRKILSIGNDDLVHELPWTPGRRVNTIWFNSHHSIFVGGGGLYVGNFITGWSEVLDLPLYYSERIRGTDINDVFVVGDYGLCGHFNGVTWRNYSDFSPQNAVFDCIAVNRDMCVVGGFVNGKAVVLRGYRR